MLGLRAFGGSEALGCFTSLHTRAEFSFLGLEPRSSTWRANHKTYLTLNPDPRKRAQQLAIAFRRSPMPLHKLCLALLMLSWYPSFAHRCLQLYFLLLCYVQPYLKVHWVVASGGGGSCSNYPL